MSTIEEIVTEHFTDVIAADAAPTQQDMEGVVAALKEREDVAVERLHLFAERFGLMRPVVSKVILELGLGDIDDDTKALIEEQYQTFLAQQMEAAKRQIEGMRAMGIPVPDYEFTDPFSVPLDTSVPDTPPES